MKNAHRRTRFWQLSVGLILASAAACSLQDFAYLQESGAAGASMGGAPQGGVAGNGQSGGPESGRPATGGTGGRTGGGTGGGALAGGSGAGGTDEAGAGAAGMAGSPETGQGGVGGASGTAGAGGLEDAGVAGSGGTGDAGGTGNPGDTNLLVNGSFESNYTGWTFEPASVKATYAYVQWPPSGATTVDGQWELSTWAETAAFTVEVSQVVTRLAAGKYTFKGWFNRGSGLNVVYLFARGCGGTEDYQEDIPLTGVSQWIEVGIGGIEVVGGRCEVGFFVDSNANDWLNADAFSFEQDPQ